MEGQKTTTKTSKEPKTSNEKRKEVLQEELGDILFKLMVSFAPEKEGTVSKRDMEAVCRICSQFAENLVDVWPQYREMEKKLDSFHDL